MSVENAHVRNSRIFPILIPCSFLLDEKTQRFSVSNDERLITTSCTKVTATGAATSEAYKEPTLNFQLLLIYLTNCIGSLIKPQLISF